MQKRKRVGRVVSIAFGVAAFALVVLIDVAIGGKAASSPPAGGRSLAEGTLNATGTAPGAKSTADPGIDAAGALTITSVRVGGQQLTVGVDYRLIGDGTSQAKVTFFAPPEAGKSVEIRGKTANGGLHSGNLSWS